jgi:hypothetical protein
MELGDTIKAVTDKMGIKRCEKCKERQAILNCISRRGFIGGAVLTAFLVKNFVLTKAWAAAGVPIPLTPVDIRAFMCLANTEMYANYFRNGKHMDRDSMLAQVASHKEHFKPTSGAYNWMSQFTPGGAPHIFPGWTLNFLSRPKGQIDHDHEGKEFQFATGFIYSMTDGKVIFVTDELSWIYVARVPPNPIDISKLTSAKDFPGAVIADIDESFYDNLEASSTRRLLQRFSDFLTPVAYAQISCCSGPSNCSNCGCANCLCSCCTGGTGINGNCANAPPPGTCIWMVNCSSGGGISCTDPCKYFYAQCGAGDCNCCINKLFRGCCIAYPPCSPGNCPQCGLD